MVVVLGCRVDRGQSLQLPLPPFGCTAQRRVELHAVANATDDGSDQFSALVEGETGSGRSCFVSQTLNELFCTFRVIHFSIVTHC